MPEKIKTLEQLQIENDDLRSRLKETEETLNAIRNGEVDAIIVSGTNGEKVFSISSSETPYRVILEQMDEGAVTVSPDGIILYFNQRFAEILSVQSDRITGSEFSELLEQGERPLFKKLLKSGNRKKVRGKIRFRDLFLELSFVPLSEIGGKNICVIITDITESEKYQDNLKDIVKERSSELKILNQKLTVDLQRLKKVGKQLKESEKKFKQLANSIPQLAWISRSDGYREWFNQRWYDYTGTNYSKMRGFGWHSVHDPIVLSRVLNRWKTCVAEEKNFEMIYPLRGKDGIYRTFLTRGIPIRNIEGKVIQWFGTNTDISDLKKVEKELENSKKKLTLALENGNIGMWEWHLKTNEMIWDERMKKMICPPHQVFDSKYATFEKFINDEDLPHFREAVNNTLKFNTPFETIFRTNAVNGESKYISTKALLTKSKNGHPLSLNGVCFDITSMKKGSEQVLIKLNEELLRSNRDLQQFAYVASHDLQEPLRMVSSFTQLLAHRYNDKLDEDARDFIKFAVDGAKRMYDLLNGLLAYSRVHSKGKEFSNVNMNEVLEKVIQNLALKIEEKNASVKFGNLPVLFADESQMIQLVQNLIENSIKFSDKKPVISVTAKFEKDYIFSIRDKGVGIEPQYYERIFQIFQRLNPKATHEGTGIGLAICKRIIERHMGRIWVESVPGKGSTFFFTIPAR